MQPRLRIRLATADDARAIGVLVRRVTRQDVLPDQPAAAAVHLMEAMTARAERKRIREGKRYHVAELAGRLVGVVATRDDSHIFRLFVSRRFQRRGIARALLEKALADCRKRSGTRKFTLNASASAVPAYMRLGFVRAGRKLAKGPGGLIATPMICKLRRRAAHGPGRSPSRRPRHN